jgi:hypothetical protein
VNAVAQHDHGLTLRQIRFERTGESSGQIGEAALRRLFGKLPGFHGGAGL